MQQDLSNWNDGEKKDEWNVCLLYLSVGWAQVSSVIFFSRIAERFGSTSWPRHRKTQEDVLGGGRRDFTKHFRYHNI